MYLTVHPRLGVGMGKKSVRTALAHLPLSWAPRPAKHHTCRWCTALLPQPAPHFAVRIRARMPGPEKINDNVDRCLQKECEDLRYVAWVFVGGWN